MSVRLPRLCSSSCHVAAGGGLVTSSSRSALPGSSCPQRGPGDGPQGEGYVVRPGARRLFAPCSAVTSSHARHTMCRVTSGIPEAIFTDAARPSSARHQPPTRRGARLSRVAAFHSLDWHLSYSRHRVASRCSRSPSSVRLRDARIQDEVVIQAGADKNDPDLGRDGLLAERSLCGLSRATPQPQKQPACRARRGRINPPAAAAPKWRRARSLARSITPVGGGGWWRTILQPRLQQCPVLQRSAGACGLPHEVRVNFHRPLGAENVASNPDCSCDVPLRSTRIGRTARVPRKDFECGKRIWTRPAEPVSSKALYYIKVASPQQGKSGRSGVAWWPRATGRGGTLRGRAATPGPPPPGRARHRPPSRSPATSGLGANIGAAPSPCGGMQQGQVSARTSICSVAKEVTLTRSRSDHPVSSPARCRTITKNSTSRV